MNLAKLKYIIYILIYILSILIVLNLPTIGSSENNLTFTKPMTVISVAAPYLVKGSIPIPPGKTATFIAKVCPSDRSLRMEIVNHGKNSKGVNAEIERTYTKQKGAICVKIKVHKDTAAGSIILRAEDIGSSAYNETVVKIGGDVCSEEAGDTRNKNSCINSMFSLGKAGHGRPAGDLILHADVPSRELSTPVALKFSALSEGVEALRLNDVSLRQVAAPQTIVDIKVTNKFSYDMRFYRPQDILKKGCLGCNRFYEFHPDAEPFVVFRIENPDADPNTYHRLRISRIKGTHITVSEYAYDKDQGIWSLTEGNDLRITIRKEEQDEQLQKRIVTEIVKDGSGRIASIVKTMFNNFPWGEEIVEIVEDPNDAALTTQKNYYEDPSHKGSYGRVKSRINPNGSWIKYEYDDMGNIIREIYPWLDSPVTALPDEARTISYDYQPVDLRDIYAPEFSHLPRKVIEKILGNTVRLNYYAYFFDASGDIVEIAERCKDPEALYGDPNNERTITSRYSYLSEGPESERIKSIQYPDGRLETYTYETRMYMPHTDPSLSAFVQGKGKDVRETIVHGTVDKQAGIPFKTTCEVKILDEFDHLLMEETYVYTDSGYARISWSVNELDDYGNVVKSYYSNGTQSESAWECCGMTFHKDKTGITMNYLYDSLGRVIEKTKEGVEAGTWPTQSDVVTTYTYDAKGRQLTETVSAGELSQMQINQYDLTGRFIRTTDPAGLVTNYEYDPASCVDTIIRPGGATKITTYYLDGQIKSINGTGVVHEYFTYGVNADGTQWFQTNTSSSDSPMWQKTTVDMLGRTITTERPGFGGTVEYILNHHNNKGQLVSTSTSGMADILYLYNSLGEVIKSGLDINHNGTLDDASNDRITRTETLYTLIDKDWWQETKEQVYATESSTEATTTNIQRTRLTGWSLGKTGESISIDIHGNQTVVETFTDQAHKTMTQITDASDSTIDQESIIVNGLQMSIKSTSGVTTTLIYDDLGRKIGQTDPRTVTTIVHYNNRGRVDYVEDPAGNRTLYTYDPNTGIKIAETNPLNKVTRFAYNNRSQVIHTWGDTIYPVQYIYDNYGRLKKMYTFRNGTGWNSETWPGATSDIGDETHWIYDEPTGFLISKLDAKGKGVSYTYTYSGKLATRTWARTNGESLLITNYSYDPDTGDLILIDYSDDTPDIAFTYDRLGRQKTIIDAVGTRTFAYDNTLQFETEIITGLYNETITRKYDAGNVRGRYIGFSLGSYYAVTYNYDETGGFSAISWNVGNTSQSVNYSYLPNSDLLHQLVTNSGLKTTYTYEPKRDHRTQVKNEFNTRIISQYDYQYDALGRRKSVANSGEAFIAVTNAFNLYGYNNRSELTSSSRYMGADINNTNHPIPSEYRDYAFDNIGNRIQSTDWDNSVSGPEAQSYTANSLNQYSQIIKDSGNPQTESLNCDDDGNLISITKGGSTIIYTYNAENRLIVVSPQSPVHEDKKVEFTYDYMGRRVMKKVFTYSSGSWTLTSEITFLYDGWNMIREMVKEGAEEKTNYYVWGLDLSGTLQGAGGIGGLLSRIQNQDSKSHLYCYDGNGNVGQLIDAVNGAIKAHYEYDPYGNEIFASGTLDNNPFRFSTKFFDSTIGLYYFGYRYYLSELGRWLNRDPIGENGGLNLYAYLSNSSINFYDPYGMFGKTPCGRWMIYYLRKHLQILKIPQISKIPGKIWNLMVEICNFEAKYSWSIEEDSIIFKIKCDITIKVELRKTKTKCCSENCKTFDVDFQEQDNIDYIISSIKDSLNGKNPSTKTETLSMKLQYCVGECCCGSLEGSLACKFEGKGRKVPSRDQVLDTTRVNNSELTINQDPASELGKISSGQVGIRVVPRVVPLVGMKGGMKWGMKWGT